MDASREQRVRTWVVSEMGSRQAGNGGRLLTQQVLPTSVVSELPVQGKLVEWQVRKKPAGVLGGWQSLPGSATASSVSSFVCVCWEGEDYRQSVTGPGAAGIVGGLEAWRSLT